MIAGSNTREIAEVESRHAAEVERLRSKLKWYAETQVLLDRDALTLKKKEEEINELKETVSRLQAQHGQTVAEKKQRGMERATDAKRIQDLERQVSWNTSVLIVNSFFSVPCRNLLWRNFNSYGATVKC